MNKIIDFPFQPHPHKVTLKPGHYRFEAWGASGRINYCSNNVIVNPKGRGAYTSGIITLIETKEFYVYVGQRGTDSGTFNGATVHCLAGGGATDFRISDAGDDWSSFQSLKSRIMVAAGGGAGDCRSGGDGGTLEGFQADEVGSATVLAGGGTQTSGGTAGIYIDGRTGQTGRFGIFGTGNCILPSQPTCDGAGSGGSGYYGGGGMAGDGGGAGGSSFISGHPGCLAILEEADSEQELKHADHSIHYSNLYFNFTQMRAGNEEMPDFTHQSATMIGNTGVGHARITFLDPYVQVKVSCFMNLISFKAFLFTCILK